MNERLTNIIARYLIFYNGVKYVRNNKNPHIAEAILDKGKISQIISDLTLTYNSARQAAITQELTEITAGSEALKA
ncbi:MAG: hypothetical protein ACD_58C00112G0010 [uncultured bacterium]|nr:MAG: hypothetical protein ACD_58C00112G0010 [uncultured bacterium]